MVQCRRRAVARALSLVAVAIIQLLFTCASSADEPDIRHGSVIEKRNGIFIGGGITATGQTTNADDVEAEALASLDLVTTVPTTSGAWTVYVEGNTSLQKAGVSSELSEANADAGSALDRDGNGRLQVSELRYTLRVGENSLAMGLIDPAGFLDASDVANDETTQFLTSSLVNNPTIAFPDYTLGIAYHHEVRATRPGFTVLLTSSHGLGDNPNASYSELMDVADEGKGMFTAGEAYWQGQDATFRFGVWTSSADHNEFRTGDNKHNYGIYALADGGINGARWNLRVGWANAKVSEPAAFASLGLDLPTAVATIGAGIAHTWLSHEIVDPFKEDSSHAELYTRFDMQGRWHISSHVQWLRNSGFSTAERRDDQNVWALGLRLGYRF